MSDRILIGIITTAHGIRGEVVVRSYAGVPEDVGNYGPLSDAAGTRTFKLKVVRVTPKGAVIARIAGVTDRNAAEALKGMELYVARDKLPVPEDGEFYHADLIGLTAVAPDGSAIGEIVAVENFGAGDLLDIRLAGKSATELVPFTDAFVPAVDIEAGKVTVIMPRATGDDDGE